MDKDEFEDDDTPSPDSGDISEDCLRNDHDECDDPDCECPHHSYSDDDVE